jgi:hypothetical protein
MLWIMIKGSVVGYTMDDHCSSIDEYRGWMLVWHQRQRGWNGMHKAKIYL